MNQQTLTPKAQYAELVNLAYPNSKSARDYYTKDIIDVVRLSDGSLLPVRKASIKKDFCFGESGYDYDDAQAAAQHARTSEDYFRSENLDPIEEEIKRIRSNDYVVLFGESYMGGASGVAHMYVATEYDILRYPAFYLHTRRATPEEREEVAKAKEAVYDNLAKRVNTYLKKYGTSKVHAWTFWLDA